MAEWSGIPTQLTDAEVHVLSLGLVISWGRTLLGCVCVGVCVLLRIEPGPGVC
jgi:hypothetical protein